MKRFMKHAAAGMMVTLMGLGSTFAGEASTSASATNGVGHPGNAAATANYTGDGGEGFARTRTETVGGLNVARGVAVGFDEDGLDVSFSHALAPLFGPAYAGTFNMSIGMNGQVSASYGGTVAAGGLARTASAGGVTRSDPAGATAQAHATGNTVGGGHVNAWTRSNSTPVAVVPVVSRGPAFYPTAAHGRPVVEARRPVSVVRSRLVR